MKIPNLITRNTARSNCYTTLGTALQSPLSNLQEIKLGIDIKGTMLADNIKKDNINELAEGTRDILATLRSVLFAQQSFLSLYNPYVTTYNDYKSQIAILNTKITNINTDISLLNSAITSKQSSITTLNTKINSGVFTQNGITYSLGAVGSQVTASQANYSKLSSNLASKLSSLNSQISTIQSSLNNANNQVSAWQTQINTYQSKANTAYTNYQYWTSKRNTNYANSEYKNYQYYTTQVSNSKTQQSNWKSWVTYYQNQITSLNNQKSSAQSEVSSANAEYQKAQALKVFGDQEMQRQKSNLTTLKQELTALQSQLPSKQSLITTTNVQITTLQGKINTLNSTTSTAVKPYQTTIDIARAKYGYTTLSYINTSETQSLMQQELDFEKNADLTALSNATTDTRDTAQSVLNFTTNVSGLACIGSVGVTFLFPPAAALAAPTCATALVISSPTALVQSFTGTNIFTGQELSTLERSLNIAQTITTLPIAKYGGKVLAIISTKNAKSVVTMVSDGTTEGEVLLQTAKNEMGGVVSGVIKLKPLGLGSTAVLPASWAVPTRLAEQLALNEIQSNPGLATRLTTVLNDTRWPSSNGWSKMTYSTGNNGEFEIHFVAQFKNGVMTAIDDFKFISKTIK